MCEIMIENDVARWEMRQLEREAARLYRAKLLRDAETKRSLARLAVVGAHVLLSLGNTLIAASEKLSVKGATVYQGGELWTLLLSK
jgi:hypothetical protein